MLANLEISLMCAVVGYVYSEILTDTGMILHGLRNWSESNLKRWLYKPLIGCFKCVIGQLSLWVYMITQWSSYSLTEHVFTVCASILIASFIDKLYYS